MGDAQEKPWFSSHTLSPTCLAASSFRQDRGRGGACATVRLPLPQPLKSRCLEFDSVKERAVQCLGRLS